MERKSMNRKALFGVAFAVLGVLLFLAPGVLAPVCGMKPDGGFMKCHWMDQAEKGIAVVMILMGLLILFVKNKAFAYGIAAANVPVGCYAYLISWKLIGGCKMPDMACNLYTRPMVYLFSGIYVLASLFYLFYFRKDLAER
jgi:hypothetical protein